MNQVLEDIQEYAAAYLDDVLVAQQHLEGTSGRQDLAKVKEKKCQFARNTCNYLGHIMGEGQVRPEQCKIDAVREFQQPRTKKQVRAFL